MSQNAKVTPLSQRVLQSITQETQGMSDAEWAWHPSEKWSVAEIVEHLSLAYTRTATRLAATGAEAQPPALRPPSLRERVARILIVTFGYIPSGRKSPEALIPQGKSVPELMASLPASLAALEEALAHCEKRFGGQAEIMLHPILGPLTVSQWRRFHYVHTLHHMRQVRAIRRKAKSNSAH